MAASNFDACFNFTIGAEGGYTTDPRDTGNWTGGATGVGTCKGTKYGISAAAYPNLDIANLTLDQAHAIYRRDYWAKLRADELPVGMDIVAFDGAVNAGVSAGAKWLQQALGVTADGAIGPQTLAAAAVTTPARAINAACDTRLAEMQTFHNWNIYGAGWTNRVNSLRAHALAMAQPRKDQP